MIEKTYKRGGKIMPKAYVRKSKTYYPDDGRLIKELTRFLTVTIAEALSVPGTEGELTSLEIEVQVDDYGPNDIHSRNLEITVFAGKYPARMANLEERIKTIEKSIQEFLLNRGTTFWLWVICVDSAFVKN